MAPLQALLPLLLPAALVSGDGSFTCPPQTPVSNFQQSKFLNLWFEYARYHPGGPQNTFKCIYGYRFDAGDGKIRFCNRLVRISDNQEVSGGGLATPIKRAGQSGVEARFRAKINGIPGEKVYDMVDVDYDSHAIFSHCSNQTKTRIAFVLTRARKPNMTAKNALESQLRSLKLDTLNLTLIDQDNCPAVQELTLETC